jgi:sortase A
MLGLRRRAPGSRGAARRWIASLLLVAGVAMLAWSAAFVIDARVSQDTARRSLELAARAPAAARSDEGTHALHLPMAARSAARGSPIAELLIPRVHLSSIVLHGSDAQTLRRGPGHLEDTPLPGQPGNVAIAGHRDTFFRELRDVQVGDDIYLNTPQGQFHYQIAWTRVVGAHDVGVVAPTTDDALTLVTCFPFWVFGPAPDRFVVRATRVDENRAIASDSGSTPIGLPAPPASIATETESPASHVAAVAAPLDDEAVIRRAIERFRIEYNGYLLKHNAASAGLLELSACDVAITGDRAEAACEASFGDRNAGGVRVRTLTLERADGAWAIRSTTD